ncbi:MAG: ABC transporter permease subunit [candidate division KSB1 bacterium]|nr:ABC transporter permease subunit [candidate division KSB1 bacterium]MDZ7407436.1 ABC transporter permease subunit [candidate division KSB1 bacterium]
MIWTIVKKEFFSHLLTFRLWAAAVLCFLLIPLTLVVSIRHYEEKLRNYNADVERYTQELREVKVYSFVRPVIVRPPQVLSILCSGIEDNVGSVVPIWLGSVPFMPTGEVYGKDNPFLAVFASMDMVFILLIVISLFSILLTYDAISGEKEQNLLRQILTNPLFRHQLLLAKYLGALFVLVPLLLASFLLATLMMFFSTSVQLFSEHIARIGLLFLLSCIYSSVFLLLGLFISSRTSRSSASLMLSLFIWVFVVLIIPNGSLHIAKQIYPIPPIKQIDDEIDALNRERDTIIEKQISQLPPQKFDINMFYSSRADGGVMVSGNPKERYDWMLEEIAIRDKYRIKYAEKKGEILRKYMDALVKQRQLASWTTTLSPAFLFQETSEALAGVSGADFLRFMQQARLYRMQIVDYLRQKKDLYPYRYITPEDETKIMPLDKWIHYITNGEYTSFDDLSRGRTLLEMGREFMRTYDRSKAANLSPSLFASLDLSDLPAFSFQALSISKSVSNVLFQLLVSLLINVLLFYFSHRSFINYDVR